MNGRRWRECMYLWCDFFDSLEGVGGLKKNNAYHSETDVLVIPELYF